MDNQAVQQLLNDNGFPCGSIDGTVGEKTKEAVKRFQTAYAFEKLQVDGIPGSLTQAALIKLPFLSPHFQVVEIQCPHCHLSYVRRELLEALELLRSKVGPIAIIDAYRCAEHNAAVPGSASNSQHVEGTAVDLQTQIPEDTVKSLAIFSGIGRRGSNASHIDVRHVLGDRNPTPHATTTSPALWTY